MKRGRLVILLVEDDSNDIFFVKRATESSGRGHTVHGATDVEEAVRYLAGEGKFADRSSFPLPNIILTDLKMPGMNGFDFLRWLRAHPHYKVIPTIVYSNSCLEQDVRKAYQLGATSYIMKPSHLAEMMEILDVTYEYWSRCECPPPGADLQPATPYSDLSAAS